MKIVVGHLYPDYLNIYADRGNIAVLARRAAWRGHELDVRAVGLGGQLRAGEHDLLYIGGGQDREQALIARDLAAKSNAIHGAVAEGAAVLAVCGGYQLLGRSYRDFHGADLPGAGLFPLETIASRANGGHSPVSRTTRDERCSTGEPRRLAAWLRGSGTTATAAMKAAASAARSGPTFTGRSSRGTPGLRTGCLRRHWRMRRAESPSVSILFATTWKRKHIESRRSGPRHVAAAFRNAPDPADRDVASHKREPF